MKKSGATVAEILKVNPKLSVAIEEKKASYKYEADLELSMDAVRKLRSK